MNYPEGKQQGRRFGPEEENNLPFRQVSSMAPAHQEEQGSGIPALI